MTVSIPVPGQPRGVRVEVLTSTSMRVTWSRPLYKGRGIFAYEVFYNKTSPAMDSNEEARNTLTKVIHGLQPYKHYGVAVAAKSDRGVGPMSFAVAVRTFEDGKKLRLSAHFPSCPSHNWDNCLLYAEKEDRIASSVSFTPNIIVA